MGGNMVTGQVIGEWMFGKKETRGIDKISRPSGV
jgi:hypothetical protein